MKWWSITFLIFYLVFLVSRINSTVLEVPSEQYPTIQKAINLATINDTILVYPGVYKENLIINKAITLGSLFLMTGDMSYISKTIIADSIGTEIVRFDTCEYSTSTLTGLSITNYKLSDGGGINCISSSVDFNNLRVIDNRGRMGAGIRFNSSDAILDNVIINDNLSEFDGGGVYCYDSNLSIKNSVLSLNKIEAFPFVRADGGGLYASLSTIEMDNVQMRHNEAIGISGCGGGICSESSEVYLKNVTLSDNLSSTYGGGLYTHYTLISLENCKIERNSGNGGGIFLDNNTFGQIAHSCLSNNKSWIGGGLACRSSSPLLLNVTISNNYAKLCGGGISCSFGAYPKLINSIIWNNHKNEIGSYYKGDSNTIAIAYSDVKNGQDSIVAKADGHIAVKWLDGNITADPLFSDTSNNDYSLQENSPCIDVGIQDTILLYNDNQDTIIIPRIDYAGQAPDLGAFEFGPTKLESEQYVFPKDILLYQNYPNPFNPKTSIEYQVSLPSYIKLSIYNILGQKLQTLVSQTQSVGNYTVQWDASNFPSGIYYYRLSTKQGFVQTRKMVVLK